MAKVTTTGGKTVRSPISSMRSGFRSLKNNLKTMAKSAIGIKEGLEQENELKKKRLNNLKSSYAKERDLKQKQSEEKRLEKPNLISSSLSNIGMNLKKTAGGILGRVLKIVGILAGGWLLKNIGGIIETVQKGVKVITDVWNGIGDFVSGTIERVKNIGKSIVNFGKKIFSFGIGEKSGKLKESYSGVELEWQKLNADITGAETVLDNPESEAFKKDFEEGGDLKEETEEEKEETEGTSNKSDTTSVGEDPTNKPKVGDYKVIETSRGDKYRVWDGGKWGPKTNTKPRSGDVWNEEKTNVDKDEDSKIESEEQVSAKDKVYQQVKNAGNKLKNQEMIEGAKKDVNQMVGKITPETKPEVITIVAPQRSDYANTRSGSKQYSKDYKIYVKNNDLNKLENKQMLEALG